MPGMSYSLGQAKWVPGQISFASLPQWRTGLPSVQPLLEAGLPIAPYIEHGSFTTGEPSIMRYGLDPYRGIMGLGQGGGAAEPVKMSFELVLEGEPRGEYLYEELSEAADALAMAFSRTGKAGKVVSPPGSQNVVADVAPGRGTVRMLHGLGQTIGQSVRRIEAQNYIVRCERPGRMASSFPVRGMSEAMKTSKRLLRREPSAVCRILLAPPSTSPGAEVVTVRRRSGDEYDVRFNYGLSGSGDGLGQLLTELACSETALAESWRNRQRSAVNASRVAAVLSGAAVGGIAAASYEGNLVIGALVGAAASAAVNALWMAPYTI